LDEAHLAMPVSDGAPAPRREQRALTLLQALSAAHHALAEKDSTEDLFAELCSIGVTRLQAQACAVALPGQQGWQLQAQAGDDTACAALRSAIAAAHTPLQQVLTSGRCLVLDDPAVQVEHWPALQASLDTGIRALALLPLHHRTTISGVFCLVSRTADAFDAELMQLLVEITGDIDYAVRNIQRDRKLAGIVASMRDAVISVDRHGHVQLFNRAAETMFGIEAGAAMGLDLTRFLIDAPDSMDPLLLRAEADRAMLTLQARHADGRGFAVEASVSRVGEGEDLRLTVILRDLSELRRVEAAIGEAKARSHFIARLSHDLKTPLNAVMGYAYLLERADNPPLSDRQRKQASEIHKAGQLLLSQINDILDMDRTQSGTLQVQHELIDLQVLVASVCELLTVEAGHWGVQLRSLPSAPRWPWVLADAHRLRQVLVNVLSNAIKYNRAGGSVTISAEPADDQVLICVNDSGLGMTAEQMAHLYEPYNRLGRDSGPAPGSGIGLCMTRDLLALMGGGLAITSTAGVGTRVRITLPGSPVRSRGD
jgi:PAS domain S-box-containing protein